jgi:hypothetical protein
VSGKSKSDLAVHADALDSNTDATDRNTEAMSKHAAAVHALAGAISLHSARVAAAGLSQAAKIKLIINACGLAKTVNANTKLSSIWGGGPGDIDAQFMIIARDPGVQAAGLRLNFPAADQATTLGGLADALH